MTSMLGVCENLEVSLENYKMFRGGWVYWRRRRFGVLFVVGCTKDVRRFGVLFVVGCTEDVRRFGVLFAQYY